MKLYRFVCLSFCLLAVILLASCAGVVKSNQLQSASPTSSAPASVENLQMLYLISHGSLTTYTVDPKRLRAQSPGSPVNLAPVTDNVEPQLGFSTDAHFLYLVWADLQMQSHISVYATDSSGAPQVPAIQTLDVSLSPQLLMHPGGKFAYLLDSTPFGQYGEYTSALHLLHVDQTTGKLREDPQVLASYGPSNWSAGLFGWSADHSHLHDTWGISFGGQSTVNYLERAVDAQSGTVGHDVGLYQTSYSWADAGELVEIGNKIILDFFMGAGAPPNALLKIFPNEPSPSTPLITCTTAMFAPCGTASGVQLDNSGQYLFFSDPDSRQIRLARIDLAGAQIRDTGASISAAEALYVVFSPDGKLVYSVPFDNTAPLQIYGFDVNMGKLTSGGTVQLPLGYAVYSAERR